MTTIFSNDLQLNNYILGTEDLFLTTSRTETDFGANLRIKTTGKRELHK